MKVFQVTGKIIWNMIPLPVCLRIFFKLVKEIFDVSEIMYHDKNNNVSNSSDVSINLSNCAFQYGNSWEHHNQ